MGPNCVPDSIHLIHRKLQSAEDISVIEIVIKLLDSGKIRLAEPLGDDWVVNEWVKTAILYYFSIKNLEIISSGEMEYYDKIEPKKNYEELKIKVVPPGVVRYDPLPRPFVRREFRAVHLDRRQLHRFIAVQEQRFPIRIVRRSNSNRRRHRRRRLPELKVQIHPFERVRRSLVILQIYRLRRLRRRLRRRRHRARLHRARSRRRVRWFRS